MTMTPKRLFILLLALVAFARVTAQNDDIPIENNNLFPPNQPADPIDTIQGSGDGPVEEPPASTTETTEAPELEEMQPTNKVLQSALLTSEQDQSCPSPCVCYSEGASVNFVVDCSGHDLEEFPSPIDPKTTTLNLHNNKLTVIPKEVASLRNLKVLNAENNSIMDLALGSVSELPELTVLKLANNRLIEYPQDLKNSLSLAKLEELDLGGNDMRGDLKPEIFSNFKALTKITLPIATPELLEDLCNAMKETLVTVCTESCNKQWHECTSTKLRISDDDDLMKATLPGELAFEEEGADPAIENANTEDSNTNSRTEDTPLQLSEDEKNIADTFSSILSLSGAMLDTAENEATDTAKLKKQDNKEVEGQVNARSGAVVKTEVVDVPAGAQDVIVGATTASVGGGGVSKSVIGIIVAGMVVVVAGITIGKNWSSIKKKFSSSPRPADRAGVNANGTAPEEVPLQDKNKSPV